MKRGSSEKDAGGATGNTEVHALLLRAADGDGTSLNSLMEAVYDELRALARSYLQQERSGHTLQATALVHEAYVRLVHQQDVSWKSRAQFFSVAAQMIRRILVDYARARGRLKRDAGGAREPLHSGIVVTGDDDALDVLALDEALAKLQALDARQAQIVELHFFGGLTLEEVAQYLGVSLRTVAGDWNMARGWLRRELREGPTP
jgi:RNA polymerase sigma factor (TIGR02999 family)